MSFFLNLNNIYFLGVELRLTAILYLCGRQLVAVGVHGGQEVDARGVDQGLHALVAQRVLGAQVLRQVEEQLAAQHLIAVHVGDQLDLWLHWGHGGRTHRGREERLESA